MVFRPPNLTLYMGQERIKSQLMIAIQAAQKREEPLPLILLSGRPGTGKTSLVHALAGEVDANLVQTIGSSIEDDLDLQSILAKTVKTDKPYRILFIDEIHSVPKIIEEKLYTVLEDEEVTLNIFGKIATYTVPFITVIGATTTLGKIGKPLRDRFQLQFEMEPYALEELGYIVYMTAQYHEMKISGSMAAQIASRSRHTPRIAVRLTERCIDYALAKGYNEITKEVFRETMKLMQVDFFGLEPRDYKLLELLASCEEPVGILNIANALGESRETLTEVIEPYLLELKAIRRTARGREITPFGLEILAHREELIEKDYFTEEDHGKAGIDID